MITILILAQNIRLLRIVSIDSLTLAGGFLASTIRGRSEMDATPAAYLLMRLSFSAVALLAFATVSGVCAASYAQASASAPSAKEAAPFALPFMLFSTASASALLLSGVAAMDKATNKR